MEFEPIWGGVIAWYLFLAGLGGGAYIASAFLEWKCPEAVKMRRFGRIVAPTVVAVGLVLLMLDAEGGLYHPWRFAYLLTNFSSVMTWGVLFLSAFMAAALATIACEFLAKRPPRWLVIVGVVLSVCVAMYTGALLGACMTFPLWNNALLPVLFLVSALSAGAAAVLLSGAFFPEESSRTIKAKRIHFYLIAAELGLLMVLLAVTSRESLAGWNSVAGLVSGQWAPLFWGGLIGVGLVAPLILEGFGVFGRRKPPAESAADAASSGAVPQERLFGALADAGVLVGGFSLRFLVVVAALPVAYLTLGI